MRYAPWYEGVLAAIDFESTGNNPREDRPVQIAAVLADVVGVDPLPGSYVSLVNPGKRISREAFEVHGISQEQAETGLSPSVMVEDLTKWVAACNMLHIPIVIFNAPFDYTLALAEGYRAGMLDSVRSVFDDSTLLDPHVINQYYKPNSTKRKLTRLVSEDNFLGQAHDACRDAMAAIHLIRDQASQYQELSNMTAQELANKMKEWDEEARININTSRTRAGKRELPQRSWPLLERYQ